MGDEETVAEEMGSAEMEREEMERARTLARNLAQWAAATTREHRVRKVDVKEHPGDLVTELDLSIERRVREEVLNQFPGHAFMGEEFGGQAARDRPTWYLDPVDGTTNLANGVPWTAFSLALAVNAEPVLGVIADPWRNDIFEAQAGAGAWRNGAPLTMTDTSSLTSNVVGTELAGHREWAGMESLMRSLSEQFCTVRIMGSGTLTLVGPAVGRGVGAVIHHFSAIDHLAATLIAHEAGAHVLDQNGEPTLFPHDGGVLVAHPSVSSELYGLWAQAANHRSAGGCAFGDR